MKKFLVAIIIVGSVLAVCAWGLSVSSDYGPGPIVQQPTWPVGLADALNSLHRVYGYWVGFKGDHVFYVGNASQFNGFAKRLSEVERAPVTLILHSGRGQAEPLSKWDGCKVPFDWEVSVLRTSKERAAEVGIVVDLWVGGHVDVDQVKIPDGIELESSEDQ